MRAAAIITAAGSGSRMGLEINKVFLPLKERTVIETAILPFLSKNQFQKIIITHSPADRDQLVSVLKNMPIPFALVEGGETRQKSVYNALKKLIEDNPETVLIHDAARPWISEKLVSSILNTAKNEGSAAPVIPSVNAMKKIDGDGKIVEHLKRDQTVSAQTPQGFHFKKILKAHEMADKDGYEAIDDTELWDRYYNRVSTIPGDVKNVKITYKEDLKHQ
ncbi:MAG: 2-C-methyl-D-erythritol 4-phosphate cytidylyltransferase [Spirochaetaceae bacterium]|nr:2-C-methyl-D-erythritol 4-phosphate cytidylyltransferase [Spirochaetaceae bacterium]